MPTWEYLTQFVYANTDEVDDLYSQYQDLPKYAPQAMIPELNELGKLGWELVHMEPAVIGKNDDILMHNYDNREWTNAYFCVFKRQVG